MTFYTKLDWPKIPTDMAEELLLYSETAVDIRNIMPDAQHFKLPDSAIKWCNDNLPLPIEYEHRIQKFFHNYTTVIHTDKLRIEAYNYVLTDNEPITNWYDDNGVILGTVQFEQYCWYKLNTQMFHRVTNLNKDRVAVTIFELLDRDKLRDIKIARGNAHLK